MNMTDAGPDWQSIRTRILEKFLYGSVAGVIGTLIIYPIDTIKTNIQSNSKLKGIAECSRSILANQGGIKGFYRGLCANLIGIIPEKAIKLTVNDLSRDYFAHVNQVNPSNLPIVYGMVSGALAGTCQVIATCPMEILKIQFQLRHSNHQLTTSDCFHVIRQLGGIRGLYRGTSVTLLRDVPFSMLFFPSHAYFKSILADDESGHTSFGSVFASGIVSGCLAAAAVTPMDVIKTRLQAPTNQYTGIWDCFSHTRRTEGFSAFFKGVVPRCMIVSPLFGITLLVYELQQKLIN